VELENCQLQVDGNDFAILHSAAQAGVRWRSIGGPVIGQFSTLLVSLFSCCVPQLSLMMRSLVPISPSCTVLLTLGWCCLPVQVTQYTDTWILINQYQAAGVRGYSVNVSRMTDGESEVLGLVMCFIGL
jgi:hypothetical protein